MNQQKKIMNMVGLLRDENNKLVTISGTIEKPPNRSGIIESSNHEAGIEDKQFQTWE
jgi:hypothetical protein